MFLFHPLIYDVNETRKSLDKIWIYMYTPDALSREVSLPLLDVVKGYGPSFEKLLTMYIFNARGLGN